MIITIARESGSGGYTVGAMLAKYYGIPVYDQDSLCQMAKEAGIYDRMPMFFNELPANGFLFALSMGADPEKINRPTTEAFMKLIGNRDCVIIGRCGNYIFRNRKDCVRIFTCGNKEGRIAMKMKYWHLTREEAEDVVFHSDRNRKDYHKFHTGENWGEAKNYDLCIDALRLGHEKTARLIIDYISAVLPGSRS